MTLDIADRVYAISTLDVSTNTAAGGAYDNYLSLLGAGVVGAESIGGVFYFTNAFDSRTEGVDLVMTYPIDWDNGSTTRLTASFNYNKSELDSDASHSFGDFSILGRVRYFGSSEDADDSPAGSVQKFDAITFFDLEGSYRINEYLRVAIGGRNLFDEYPDEIDRAVNGNDYCCGREFASPSVVDWQGGYYYLRVNASL